LGHEPPDTFGARVRRLRRAAGYTSREELAEAIQNPSVSSAVIKNIEAGRKADISVVHLFEIAFALHVSPLVLLIDFSEPYQPARVAGLGPNFDGVTNIELDEWFTEPASYAPLAFSSDDYRERLPEVHQMFASREHRIAATAAKQAVETVRKALRGKEIDRMFDRKDKELYASPEEEKRHLDHLRMVAYQSEQLLQAVSRGAEQLGVDLTEED
jgi:transcriptional regulator with XRE-family HTH domain